MDGPMEFLFGIVCFFAGIGVRDLAYHVNLSMRKRGTSRRGYTYGQ